MTLNKNKLSVIIPVYNVSNYLNECLDSLILFNNDKAEIILIDDGSTDNSGQICDDYANKTDNIKVIHKKNGGLSSARNVGIEKATGEWITFIDSDDLVVPNYLNILLKSIDNSNSDLIFFKQKSFYGSNIESNFTSFEKKKIHDILKEKALYYLTNLEYGNFAVTKIYKQKLFKKIRFPEGKSYEDIAIAYKIVDKANTFQCYDDYLYYYRQRNDSVSHSQKKNPETYIDAICFAYYFSQYLSGQKSSNKYIKLAVRANNYFLYSQYLDFVYVFRNDFYLKDYYKKIIFMDEMYPHIKTEGLKVTVSTNIYRKSPDLFYIFYGVFKRLKKSLCK